MKKIWAIIAVAVLIAASVLAYFTTISAVKYTALCVASFDYGIIVMSTIKTATKKTWREYLCVGLFILAGLLFAVVGFSKDSLTQLIAGISSVIALIAGLLVAFIPKKLPAK